MKGSTDAFWPLDPEELEQPYGRLPATAVRRPNPAGPWLSVTAAVAAGLVCQRAVGGRTQFGALWLELAPGQGVEVRHTALPDRPVRHCTHTRQLPRYLGVPGEYLPGILRGVREYRAAGLPLGNVTVTVVHGAHCQAGSTERLFYDLTLQVLDRCLGATGAGGHVAVPVTRPG